MSYQVKPVQSLADQIMDELMDGNATVAELSYELGATQKQIWRSLKILDGLGLVEVKGCSAPKFGRPQDVWGMTRTRRTA